MMMETDNITYEQAYVEVISILKHLPIDEYKRIPQSEIEFYNSNKDDNYTFEFNESKPIDEQDISKKTYAILLTIFRDYFASDKQKEKIKEIYRLKDEEKNRIAKEKYNPDDLFKNKEKQKEEVSIQEEQSTSLVEIKKESIIRRFINKLKSMLKLT